MSYLTGPQASQLSEALREAFLPDALDELLLFALEIRREDYTLADNYRSRVFQIIRSAHSEGWLFDLVTSARRARPRNLALHAVAAEMGLSAGPPGLERVLRETVPYADVSAWLARLGALQGQVCRVEIPVGPRAALGTGFLVASDLCLTNQHVVRPLIEGDAEPTKARLLFDYRRAADGTVVNTGTPFRLADDWLVAARPPSLIEFQPSVADRLPLSDELDFALLRLRGTPGHTRPGRISAAEQAPIRGWIEQVASAGFERDNPLFLLQHPDGAPLKLSFGQSLGLNANATRLRHDVNTEGGSSGSPCFNAQLELVGIHHAGDRNFDPDCKPIYNSAIPIHAIIECLRHSPVNAAIFPASIE